MRKNALWSVAALMLLLAAPLAAAPCAPSDTALCLNASRFKVAVHWQDTRGRSGDGQAVSLTADTGYFWFFSPSNIELVVKVLDARSINQSYWVFFGALSNVQYDLTVTDSATGAVKTYRNPQGQFASVGDTSAFAAAVDAPPTSETMDVAGTLAPPKSLEAIQSFIDRASADAMDASPQPAAAFTPCSEGAAFLYLANCRFRLDVHWTDSHGRHGAGQAVQLTADTGYFWFFSSTNVELMVKVLDARPVNGQFWVFFGALSNVEYTINVMDTVSGALHSYSNPQGTFASIGDTTAFRRGVGIEIQNDDALRVSGLISSDAGGSLSATSADGTVFTLLIPPDSLIDDELVTMTPVRSTGVFPFAGGLASGVDIEPSGTPLLAGATLSIHTPSPIAVAEETPVAWNGAGEDFYLFPPLAAAGDLQMDLSHLGGYGVARGSDAERQAQLGREPVADGDRLSHQMSPLLRDGRAEARATSASRLAARSTDSTAASWKEQLRSLLDQNYQVLKIRMIETDGARPSVVVDLSLQMIAWIREVEANLGPVNVVFHEYDRMAEIRSLLYRIVSVALQKIHERCSEDALMISDIHPIDGVMHATRLVEFVPELESEFKAAIKCFTMQLEFKSEITITGDGTFTYRVIAKGITLSPSYATGKLQVKGEGPIYYETITYPGAEPPCSVTSTTSGSTFKARIRWRRTKFVGLAYDPGQPSDSVTYTCPATRVIPELKYGPKDWWPDNYALFHWYDIGDATYRFSADDWALTGQKSPWGVSISAKVLENIAEITKFTLVHTPE